MVNIVNYKGLVYNDVSIVPSIGGVSSRTEIPIEGYRIIVAGMSSIIGMDFLNEWIQLPQEIRPLIHLQRDQNSIKHLKFLAENNMQDWVIVGIGLNTLEIEKTALELGYKNILLDIAHGGLPGLDKIYNRLRSEFGEDANLICGCVSTEEQIAYLESIGWDTIRVGVGSGFSCATRYVAGVAIGAFTEVLNARSYFGVDDASVNIVADGGFYNICDFGKAFLAGADFCMSGFVFTKCKNAQLHIDGTNEYYGMSSSEKGVRKGQTQYDESLTNIVSDKHLYSLYDLLMKIWGGIRSSISYAGNFKFLEEAIGNGEFCILEHPIKNIDW